MILCTDSVFLFQPSTPVSHLSLWRRTHHHRGRMSLRAMVHRRATRSPFLSVTLAAWRPHKRGWVWHQTWQREVQSDEWTCASSSSSLSNNLSSATSVWLLISFLFCHLYLPLQASMSAGKQGSAPPSQTTEKRPEDPRTLQQRRYKQSENTSTNHFVCDDGLFRGKANEWKY